MSIGKITSKRKRDFYLILYMCVENAGRRKAIMAKDFNLDVQALSTHGNAGKEERLTSVIFCTVICN